MPDSDDTERKVIKSGLAAADRAKKKLDHPGLSTLKSVMDRTKVKMDVGERAWTQSQIFEANMEIRNRQAEEAEKVEEARRKEEWEWEEHKHTKSIGEWRKSNRLTFWAVVIAFASLATGALTFLYNYLFPNG